MKDLDLVRENRTIDMVLIEKHVKEKIKVLVFTSFYQFFLL